MRTHRRGSNRYNDIYTQAEKLPIQFLYCRVYGHKWGDKVTVDPIDRNHMRLWNDCERCASENWKDWTLRGTQVAAGIKYPKEYLFDETGVLETADRDILREILLSRLAA